MKPMRIFLIWALLLGYAPLALGQQSDEKGRKENADSRREIPGRDDTSDKEGAWEEEDPGDSDAFEMAGSRERGNRAPDSRNRSKDMVAGDLIETKALAARDEMAENFGIRHPKDRDDLLTACRKYYQAKELLDAQYADKESEEYRKKAQVLEREYSRELWQVLPES